MINQYTERAETVPEKGWPSKEKMEWEILCPRKKIRFNHGITVRRVPLMFFFPCFCALLVAVRLRSRFFAHARRKMALITGTALHVPVTRT